MRTVARGRWGALVVVVVATVGLGAGAAGNAGAAGVGTAGVPAQAGAQSSYTPTGPLVADTGFRPENNGFSFENYGNGPYKNLTPAELRKLFGDQVCASAPSDTCD